MVKCISCGDEISEEQSADFEGMCPNCVRGTKFIDNYKVDEEGYLKPKPIPKPLGVNCYLCEKEIEKGSTDDASEAVYNCIICEKPVCDLHHEDRDWGILLKWKEFRPVCDKCNTRYFVYTIAAIISIAFGIGIFIGLSVRFGWFS